MTDRDELAVFDDDLIATTATDHDLAAQRLETLARGHQASVRDLPGVDNIVYEWRNHFHRDPLLARTETGYYLALPDHVWDEFGDDVAASDLEQTALKALHDRQARAVASDVGFESERLDDHAAVVLVRP